MPTSPFTFAKNTRFINIWTWHYCVKRIHWRDPDLHLTHCFLGLWRQNIFLVSRLQLWLQTKECLSAQKDMSFGGSNIFMIPNLSPEALVTGSRRKPRPWAADPVPLSALNIQAFVITTGTEGRQFFGPETHSQETCGLFPHMIRNWTSHLAQIA